MSVIDGRENLESILLAI